MTVRTLVAAGAATLLLGLAGTASGATPVRGAVAFLEAAQGADGGFAERGRRPDGALTAWAALALVAGGAEAGARDRALAFLRATEAEARTDTDVAVHVLARLALGDRPAAAIERLRAHRPGALVNATTWVILALRAAGEPAPAAFVQALRAAQHRSGGFSWARGGAPDSNDTAAAIEALVAAGVRGRPIDRAVAALRRFANRDGGYGLLRGRPSDVQSTAWAAQALLATGREPPRALWRWLARMRRADGSYRYSARYATTPVWVTAQAVPALAGRPFPFRAPGS